MGGFLLTEHVAILFLRRCWELCVGNVELVKLSWGFIVVCSVSSSEGCDGGAREERRQLTITLNITQNFCTLL